MHLKYTTWRAVFARTLGSVLFGIWALAGVVSELRAQIVDTVISTNLFEPYGVAVDEQNNYYITDSANNRVLQYNPSTGTFTNLAGIKGEDGQGAVDATGEFARLYNPQGIVAVRDGIVISDSGNHLIRHISFSGVVKTLAGSLQRARQDPLSNIGNDNGVGANARFNSPAGLAYYQKSNVVYIADVQNNAIRKLELDSQLVSTLPISNLFRPAAVTVDTNGTIYIADTGNHSIKRFRDGEVPRVVAGGDSRFSSGFLNGGNALETLFNAPRGILWVAGRTELLVSDSGNHAIRRIYNLASENPIVETFANTDKASLVTPVGLARDIDQTILIVDIEKDALRSIRVSQTIQPPVPAPDIGTVVVTNTFDCFGTAMTIVTNATFNNEVVIAMRTQDGTETFFTSGPSEDVDILPDPTRTDFQPPPYQDCMDNLPVNLLSKVTRHPRLTIKAISTQADRRPSPVIRAQFIFQVGNPSILGASPFSARIETVTQNADIWYTTGESDATTPDPIQAAPSRRYTAGVPLVIGKPIGNVIIKARAFRPNYVPSSIVRRSFLTNDASAGALGSVGITTDFIGGVGSTVVVPIEVLMEPDSPLFSLQFRVEVASKRAGAVAPALRTLPITENDFFPIAGGSGTNTVVVEPYSRSSTNGLTTNGLGLAFLGTNSSFKIVNSTKVALVSVQIPETARQGEIYEISVLQPSGTSDGLQTPVVLTNLENRTITVTNIPYILGDSAVAGWYNQGDFGDLELNNNDVNNAFIASLGFRIPYRFSDLFDAMDVFPEDTPSQVGGDGQIRFLDWQVLLKRSLRLAATNWVRAWSDSGVRVPLATGVPALPLLSAQSILALASTQRTDVVWNRQVLLTAGTREGIVQGAQVEVPVTLTVESGLKLSGMQFVAYVVPDGDTVPIQSLQFASADGIPSPSVSGNSVPGLGSLNNGVYCAWNVGAFQPGLAGSNLLGRLQFTVPTNVKTFTRYVVYFSNADGAGDQNTQFDFETIRGSVWVNAVAQQPPERLPDEWKQKFFGSLTDPLADASADPDKDGASNLSEYLDGTDPNRNNFRFLQAARSATGKLELKWFASSGVSYSLEASSNLRGTNWTVVADSLAGNGEVKTVSPSNTTPAAQYYRLRKTP